LSESLKSKTVSGFLWSFISIFSNQGLGLIFHILIARIVLPSDFGLLGMLAIFISFSNLISSSGLPTAIVQKKDLSEKDKSSVFYFNVFVAVFCYLILFLSAPIISEFFREPRLTDIARVYGLTVLIYSFSMVQGAILEKEINFKKIAIIKTASMILGGFVGLFLAYKGFGVWSLVYKLLFASLINVVLLWGFSDWKPKLMFCFSSIKSLLGYSSKLLASGVLHTIYMNIISVIIGRYYSASELGYYSQAKRINQLPSQNLSDSVGVVMFPAFSSIQGDDERMKQVLRKVLKATVWIIFPVVLFIGAVSESLIKIVLTEKWLPMTPYLQIICIGGILYPINKINLNLCKAKGESGLYLKIEIIQKVVLFTLILSSIKFGAIALVIAEVIAVYIAIFFNMKMCGKLVNYSLLEQLSDIFPIFIVSLLTMMVVFFVGKVVESSYISLSLQTISSIVLYFGISYILKIKALVEIKNLLSEKYKKVKLNA
jgi:teichuronic acid exporter